MERITDAQSALNLINAKRGALEIEERNIEKYRSQGKIADRIAAENRAAQLRSEISQAMEKLNQIRDGRAENGRHVRAFL